MADHEAAGGLSVAAAPGPCNRPGTGGTAEGTELTAVTTLASFVTHTLAITLTEPLCPRISACVYVKMV